MMEEAMQKITTQEIDRRRTDRHEFILVRTSNASWYITRQPINRKTGEPWQYCMWIGEWYTQRYCDHQVFSADQAENLAKEAWATHTGVR